MPLLFVSNIILLNKGGFQTTGANNPNSFCAFARNNRCDINRRQQRYRQRRIININMSTTSTTDTQTESMRGESSAKGRNGLNVLVTGATGFLGSHLCEALHEEGYEVYSISRRALPSPSPSTNADNAVTDAEHHFVCDLTATGADSNLSQILTAKPWHAIIHLAGLISYTPSDNDAMQRVNVHATRQLVEQAIAHSPSSKFLYCSSVVAVGSNGHRDDAPVTEDHEWDTSIEHIGYVQTKKRAEDIVRSAGQAGKLNTVSLCPSNIFGARDAMKASRKSQVRAANGKMKLYTHGGVSVVHVKVVVAAFMKVLTAAEEDGQDLWNGSRWLITGDNVTVKQMLTLYSEQGGNAKYAPWLGLPNWLLWCLCWVMQTLGSKSMTMDRFLLASRYNWYDGSRARNRFDLPVIPASMAVADSVKWMRENGLIKQR